MQVRCERIIRSLLIGAVIAVGLSAASDATADGKTMARAGSEPGWVRHFPLWKVVPSKRFATLGEGVEQRTRWGVFVYRPPGEGGGQRPCVEAVNLSFHGTLTHGADCGPLSPPAGWPTYALTGMSFQYGEHGRRVGSTVLGMTLARNVRRVTMVFAPGPPVGSVTRELSTAQAAKARVHVFRYVVLSLPREACLRSVSGFDQLGNEVISAPSTNCPEP